MVLGAGGNSRDIIDTINDINNISGEKYEILGILDDNHSLWKKEVMGVKVLGPIESASSYDDCLFINGVYSVIDFFNNIGVIKKSKIPEARFETIIHPSVNMSRTAEIGRGTFLSRNVILMSNVRLGKHVVIHPGVVVSHDSKIGDYSFAASTASFGGYVNIGESCFIGSNSSIRERINIGDHTIVGMGSVVLQDIERDSVYVGNPAKFLKKSR